MANAMSKMTGESNSSAMPATATLTPRLIASDRARGMYSA
jgi:hypothetical protein